MRISADDYNKKPGSIKKIASNLGIGAVSLVIHLDKVIKNITNIRSMQLPAEQGKCPFRKVSKEISR